VDANEIEHSGSARVLFGEYGPTKSKISSPMNANYLAVKLKASESWRYLPPRGHLVLWIAVASGILSGPDNIGTGELVVFEQSGQAVTFTAKTDVEFVLGSAAPHDHELVLGNYSVHTSAQALLEGERRIASLGSQLTR
jgi:redox-sensitive bicupin YhaK (pirin superfamily)